MGSRLADFGERVERYRRISFDTSACIYFLGGAQPWRNLLAPLLLDARRLRRFVEVSEITQLELLVRPYRTESDDEFNAVMELTAPESGVQLSPIGEREIHLAARIRAVCGLKIPDALVVASAVSNDSEVVVGNDRQFKRIETIVERRLLAMGSQYELPEYIHLDDYVDAEDK